MSKHIFIIYLVTGIFLGIFFNNSIITCLINVWDWCFETFSILKHTNLFTIAELSEYNGETRPELYLTIMGTVYDVTKGRKHYGKGSPYHYFVGKDGTRAFVTGDFKDNTENKDHILDLSCDELMAVIDWKKTIKNKYKLAGFLIGRYYDRRAKETAYHLQCLTQAGRCIMEKVLAKEEARKFPPCNIAWSAEEGTRVWCTTSSGGISREWTGVPRQLYSPGSDRPHCVCVKDIADPLMGMFKEYENCANTSTTCYVEQD